MTNRDAILRNADRVLRDPTAPDGIPIRGTVAKSLAFIKHLL